MGYGVIDQHLCEEIGLLEFSSRSCTEMPGIINLFGAWGTVVRFNEF